LQHPAAGARRGTPHRQLRPGDRLQEHRRDHDLERRRARHAQGPHPRVRAGRLARRFRAHGGKGEGRDRQGVQPRVPQPARRRDRVPPADAGAHRGDRDDPAARSAEAAERGGAHPQTHSRGQRLPGGSWLRRALRGAALEARRAEIRRRSPVGEDPGRRVCARGRDRGRCGPRQGAPGVPRALRHEGVIRRLLFPTLTVVSILLVPRPARGQEQTAPGGMPDSVIARGMKRVTQAVVLQTAGLVPGRFTTYRDIQRAIRALYATGQFDNVRIDQDTTNERQILLIQVHERPILMHWTVRGVSRLSEGTVRSKVTLSEARPLDPAAVARARGRIDSLYRARGYYLAQVKVLQTY